MHYIRYASCTKRIFNTLTIMLFFNHKKTLRIVGISDKIIIFVNKTQNNSYEK